MTWSDLDWSALDRLRDGFLSGSAASGPYWRSLSDLASYDFTYAERIGWKWDAVLAELRRRNWTPPARTLLDWGCGSGIAGRRVIESFGAENFDTLQVWDHSPLARQFAATSAREKFPALSVSEFTPHASPFTLLLSHVVNELPATARAELLALVVRADAVIWIEPGTHAVSRDLASIRDQLRADFDIVAPCTHANNCPLFAVENERHWCHYFAPAPSGIYADSNWVKFGQRAGVDLRSLPYSVLVLERKNLRTLPSPLPPDSSRILGRANVHKAHTDLLACDASGLNDLKLFKRTDPALHKQLDRRPPIPLYHFERDATSPEKITAAQVLFP
ncbi:MAG: small ribosomal subunit Rsm22 family protein [Nibricoccus sp.]